MSYSSNSRAIEPFKLLSESFAQAGPVYLPLLLLAVPATVLTVGQYLTSKPQLVNGQVAWTPTTISLALTVLNLVFSLVVFGGVFLLTYRYVKQGTTDVSGSLSRGAAKSFILLIAFFVAILAIAIGFLCLIAPGIYLSVALGFFPCAILSENCSIMTSFKYSMALVKGRWWATFGSYLVMILPIIPILIVSSLAGAVFGSALGAAGSKLISIDKYTNIVFTVLSLFLLPVINIYNAKMYARLQETTDPNILNSVRSSN